MNIIFLKTIEMYLVHLVLPGVSVVVVSERDVLGVRSLI